MKSIPVRSILGLASIPTHRTSASTWLSRKGVVTHFRPSPGGSAEHVGLLDLPADVRQAYLERQAEEAGIDPGEYDDAAHIELAKAPLKAQEKALSCATQLMFITKCEYASMNWVQTTTAGRKKFGKFVSRNTMKAWKRATEGVEPANWAPALAPAWSGGSDGHPVSPEAWRMLCNCIRFGGKNGTGLPLKHAYRMVSIEATVKGWDWPKLHTIRRRWKAMPNTERVMLELGDERGKARLQLHQPQHSASFAAMDLVEGDGREFKVRCIWPDGHIGCPLVVAIVDRASRKTVGWAVGKSENAEVTEAAILDMCESHGRPIALKLDNGGAFNSKRIAGGLQPYFRRKQTRAADWDVPGVLKILGIELRNTGVAAKKSNLQENVWSHMRHYDNDPTFYQAQRPGPNDPECSQGTPVPIDVFESVIANGFTQLNANTDNRVKGLKRGESREQAFERLLNKDVKRVVTPLMRRRLNMVWKRKTVQPDGTIRFDGGLFGDGTTQEAMLDYAGRTVLVGFNPKDYDAPAMVCTWEGKDQPGRLILESLPAVKVTEHGSDEGRRRNLTEKRRINKMLRDHKKRYPDSDVFELRETLLRQARENIAQRNMQGETVVELPSRDSFAPSREEVITTGVSYLTPEHLQNFERSTALRQAARE